MENEIKAAVSEQKTRRAFVKVATQVAVTAPAVSMLLASSVKPASAAVAYDAPIDHGSFPDPIDQNSIGLDG